MNHVGNLANLVDIQVFQVSVNGKPRRYASLFPDREQHLGNLARKPLVISLKAYQEEFKVKNLVLRERLKMMLSVRLKNLSAVKPVVLVPLVRVVLVLLQVERMRAHRLRMLGGGLEPEGLT